jgi:S1-C subfamily serine protease
MKKILSFSILIFTIFLITGCYNTETTLFTIDDIQTQITEVYEEMAPMTVAVVSYVDDTYIQKSGHGSGLIYDRETLEEGYRYYVITNYHVVESQSHMRVYTGKYYPSDVYAIHEAEDLALVTFDTTDDLTYFGTEQFTGNIYVKPNVGSFVLAIGTPLDLTLFNTVSFGIVGLTSNPKVIQHDASINPGNSGGPLFDLNGNLLGFNTWKRATAITSSGEIAVEGIGFAISMIVAIPIINQMRQTGESTFQQPKIGITVVTVENAIGEVYGGIRPTHIEETQNTGIYVLSVVPLRPAYGKIYEGDIITHLNDVELLTIEDLALLLQTFKFGDEITLTIRRLQADNFVTIDIVLVL